MAIPPISELEAAAKKLVWAAVKKGNLREFTPRIIRQEIEKEFSLEGGSLDASEYRSAIKIATKAALDETPPEESAAKPESKPMSKMKRKSDAAIQDEAGREETTSTPNKPKMKGKGKEKAIAEKAEDDETPARKKRKVTTKATTVISESEDEDEGPSTKKKSKDGKAKKTKKAVSEDEDDYEEGPATPKKKPKGAKAEAKPKSKVLASEEEKEAPKPVNAPKAKPRQNRKDSKEYKSLEHVPTSDMEMDEPAVEPAAGSSIVTKARPSSKDETTPRKSAIMKATAKEPTKAETVKAEDAGAQSDSAMSVLVDEPPKRERKSTSSEKEPKKAAKSKELKKTAKTSITLSKDEETIKRLKALVVACGTRKVWSKVFQGLDTPQQQIKKLKEMLAELGMSGRMSMEQAKAIKQKREFEQELEDVKEFAQKVVGRSSRSRTDSAKQSTAVESDKADSASEDDEEEVAAPSRRPKTARKSIMAFLEDQSDDE